MELPQRKHPRLKEFDSSTPGAYFITICTDNRKPILSKITLKKYGAVAEKYIKQLNDFYDNISINNYYIMPDHIHLLISVRADESGQSGTPVPTLQNEHSKRNSIISKFVSTFKRFCNKTYGHNIWQERYYDHIIRNQADYIETWKYIDDNPAKRLREKNKGV